jgi:hypothetical protein
MVTAMRTPATIHATDIHSPPQTIHSKLSKKDKADIAFFPNSELNGTSLSLAPDEI